MTAMGPAEGTMVPPDRGRALDPRSPFGGVLRLGLWARLSRWWLGVGPLRARPGSARGPLAIGASPALAPAGSSPRLAAPWLGDVEAPSVEASQVRAWLVGSLLEERDRHVPGPDRDLVERLLRLLGSQTLDFPLFPDVAWELNTLLQRGDPSITEVARLVRREPDLVRRVWAEASGAEFARKVGSLNHAIARIGFDSLWRVVMRASMQSTVFKVRGWQGAVDQARSVAIVTAEVAAWLGDEGRGDLFLSGLLHNAGQLLVLRAAGPPRAADGLPGRAFVLDLQRRLSASFGLLVADTWQLGPTVGAAIAFCPAPLRAPPEHREGATIVQIARIAALTALEARTHRDVGGVAALFAIQGLTFDPARTVEKAVGALKQLEAGGGTIPG